MMLQGRVVRQGARELTDRRDKVWHVYEVTVLDRTLNDLVEVTHFLKDGQTERDAPLFGKYAEGENIELPVKRVTVYRGRVQAEAA